MKDRKKNRLDSFHYTSGYFFVTINVKNHHKVFWEIVEDEMILNEYGKIVQEKRLRLSKQYSYIKLYDFVVMPNHFHGIIYIDDVGNGRNAVLRYSLQQSIKWLSSIIWAFKTTSSKLIRKTWLKNFQRQKSFYDHIIRNEEDMNRIVEYIQRNPYKRENDEYYTK